MQWFKHDTAANMDAKLQEVLLDYGLEGYGLYWYCIELIAGKVDKNNITFALEHDARIIARNTGSTVQKVEEMMRRFVDLGLFETSDGVITCMKLAKRLDQSMTSNAGMRALIAGLKNHDQSKESHDAIMMPSSKELTESCKNRIDKNRVDNNKPLVDAKPQPAKFKYSAADLGIANDMYQSLLSNLPEMKKPNLESWASEVRKMREIDKLDVIQMGEVWRWARNDSFWSSNILSAKKFREKYPQLLAKMRQPAKSTGYQTANEKAAARMAEIRDPNIAGNW